MAHEATWIQVPDFDTRLVGQYYCSLCKFQLLIAYNQHYEPAATGWHWTIQDSDGRTLDSAGKKHVSNYDPAVGVG
jgi:hypothetical protein